MKKILFLFMAIIGCAQLTNAQQVVTKTVTRSSGFLDSKIVIDPAGKILSNNDWRELLSSGRYSARPVAGTDTVKLIKLTDAEIEEREANAPPPFAALPFPIGEKMEMFSARDITGKKIDPKALEGKTVVVNFWFIACAPCKAEIPELNKLAADYSTNPDVVFIAVCLDQRWEIKDFMKTNPFNFMQVADGRQYAGNYKVSNYPTSVVIDKQGIIRYSSQGFGMGYIRYMKEAIKNSVGS